jgi:hypothetical protein
VNATALEACDDGNGLPGDSCFQCAFEPADSHEPDDTSASSNALTPSSTYVTDHTIVETDDVDFFAFSGTAGSSYVARTWGDAIDCGAIGYADTVLTLYDSDGQTVIESNDDAFRGISYECSHIDFTVPSNGTYYIAVSSKGASYGSYELQVVELIDDAYAPNDSFVSAAALSVPSTTTGLVDLGKADVFSFSATAGQSYTANITDSVCQPGDQSDLGVQAHRDDGSFLAEDAEYGTGTCGSITFAAPATETVYISVQQSSYYLPGATYSLVITAP